MPSSSMPLLSDVNQITLLSAEFLILRKQASTAQGNRKYFLMAKLQSKMMPVFLQFHMCLRLHVE